jgi:hypothetical protein
MLSFTVTLAHCWGNRFPQLTSICNILLCPSQIDATHHHSLAEADKWGSLGTRDVTAVSRKRNFYLILLCY